jgi:hypothetical protein
MRASFLVGWGLGVGMASVAAAALAQGTPQQAPPAPYPYGPPPYQPYATQPGYPPPGYPPPGYPPGQQLPQNAYPNGYPGAYAGPYAPTPPTKLPYREGVAPPAGYHLEENPRKGLVISGAIVLGTTYFLSASIGMASSNHDDRWLAVPVLGPFLDLGARGDRSSCPSDATCPVEIVIRTYLAIDGVVQAAGALLLISGFAFQKKEFVSDTYYSASQRGPRLSLWSVTPDVVPGSRYGLMLRGAIF